MKYRVHTAIFAISLAIVSCSTASNPVDPQPEQGEAYRNLLKNLDWGTDTCYIYGHKTPDVDAATSALSMATLISLTLGRGWRMAISDFAPRSFSGVRI